MNALQKCAAVALVAVLSLSGCLPTIGGGTQGGGSQGSGQSGGGSGGDGSPEVPVAQEPIGPDAPAPGFPEIPDLKAIPASFPADVPLVSGEVVIGVEAGNGWTVILRVADHQSAFAEASAALTAAGFAVVVEQSGAGGSVGSYSSAAYDVQVTASNPGDGPTVTYIVSTR